MKRTIQTSHFSLPVLFCLGACGFSGEINSSLSQQEKSFEQQASQQVLQQADLMAAKAKDILPTSTEVVSIPVPMSQCTLTFTNAEAMQSLTLATPACAINPPPEAQQFSLKMTLQELTFMAQRATGSTQVSLQGEGRLDISAQIPIVGAYSGQASYEIWNSSIDTQSGALQLHAVLSYKSGTTMADINIDVTGSREQVQGTIKGAGIDCTVSGSLSAPGLKCQSTS